MLLNFAEENKQFKYIFDKYHQKIYGFVKSYVKSNDDAKDVLQNIFIHIWKHKEIVLNSDDIEPLLFKTTKQEVANWYRENKKITLTTIDDETVLDFLLHEETQEDDAVELESSNSINKIKEILQNLPYLTRYIFHLNKFEGKTYKEIAEDLQITEKKVENQIAKSFKFIRQHYIFTLLPFLLNYCKGFYFF